MKLNTSLIDKVILNREQAEFSYSQPSPPYSSAGFNQIRRQAVIHGEARRAEARKNMVRRDNGVEDKTRHQITQQRIRTRTLMIKK